MKPIVTGSLVVVTLLSLAANALLYLRYSSTRPLVTVGSQVITKKQYQDALDYQTQGAVLKKMVLSDLVNQAAARAGLTPTAAQVDAQIAALHRRDPQALAAADADPTQMAQFRQDIQTEMALENLRLQGVKVTHAEVAAYYASHRASFALPAQVQTTMVLTENVVDAAQASVLLRQGIGLDVIERQPRLHVLGVGSYKIDWQAMPPALSQRVTKTVLAMHPGEVLTLPLGKYDLVVRASKHSAAGVPPLSAVRPEVVRLVALKRAVPATTELARLYQASKPQFAVARYENYFADVAQADTNTPPAKTADAQ